jgi:hypothetical protein
MSMRRRADRLRYITASQQDQGVSPGSTGRLSRAVLSRSMMQTNFILSGGSNGRLSRVVLNPYVCLYSAPKARENPSSGFDSKNPVNKRTDYSKEWSQVENGINELNLRANWIFKATNIIYLSVIGLSGTVFMYPEIMRETSIAQWPILFAIMFYMGISIAILTLPVYLLMRSFFNSILPYNYGPFFIEVFFVNKMARMTISALTHSPSTVIVTSVIIAVIAAYRLFGSYLGRRAKLLRRRLNPQAPRQTPLPSSLVA